MKRAIYLGIAGLMLAFTVATVVASETAIEAFFRLALFSPFVFWLVWQALWGSKRTRGVHERISENEAPPSKLEKSLATSWLLLRRVVCGVGFILFIVASVWAFMQQYWLEGVFCAALSIFCLWHGIVGSSSTGPIPALPKHELRTYSERKRRYGWRW